MKGRFQFSLAVVFLIIAGLGLALYKHFALGFPLLRWGRQYRLEH